MPAKPLNPEQIRDAERLRAKFKAWQAARKERGESSSQDSVAELFGFGQSALSQYLRGAIPLGIPALSNFARVLGCEPDEISPSLAAEARRLAGPLREAEGRANENVDIDPTTLPHYQEFRDGLHNTEWGQPYPPIVVEIIAAAFEAMGRGVAEDIIRQVGQLIKRLPAGPAVDQSDTQKASLPSVQPMDETSSGSKFALSEKGQAAHRAKLPGSENPNTSHERPTGTEGKQ